MANQESSNIESMTKLNINETSNSSSPSVKKPTNNQLSFDDGYLHKTTSALHFGQAPEQWAHQPIIPPIYLTSNYAQPTPGISDYEYSRSSNPTRNSLEQVLASTESAQFGLSFSSGLGALTTTVFLLQNGDHVLCCDDTYGGVYRFFNKCAPRMGIKSTFVEGTTVESWTDNFIDGKTKMLWIESPTNPMMKIMDLRKIVEAVRKIDPDVLVVVDNTFMTPIFQSPLKLGADIVMHSCTKYLNGHSDLIMGALMTNNQELYARLRFNQNALGIVPSAFDCYLLIRSIKTLEVRVKQQAVSAMKIAEFLESHPFVERVLYPGLKSHPQHELATREFSGYGGMISFALKEVTKNESIATNGDIKTNGYFLQEGIELVKRVKVFHCAVSLGCVGSLIQIPSLMTHAAVDESHRLKLGMTDRFIRLSIGLENVDELIQDLDQALTETQAYLNLT